jgi:hypothetical protein
MGLMDHVREPRLVRRSRSAAGDRGAVMAEFALVLPVLAMLVMGIFTGGTALNNKQQITSSARDAARFGATLADDQCDSPSDCGGRSWAELVRDLAVQRSNGTLLNAGVCVALVSGPGSAPTALDASHTTKTDGTACFVDGSPDDGLRVQVSTSRSDVLDVVLYRKTLSLEATAIAQFES